MDVWTQMRAQLAELERQGLRRHGLVAESAADARVQVAGVEMVCLASNNYLGLANHPAVVASARKALEKWGVGAGSSRLIAGTSSCHIELQQALARFKGTEAAIVTATGWQANACALAALAGPEDLVLADKLDHASILDAVQATGATLRTYRHGEIDRLRALLERLRPRHRRCILVTDGVFSMDGDVAPLAELAEIKTRYDALLVVDEAHATGVLGENGRGSAELAGVEKQVDVTVGTLSKAIGAMGGFVAGPQVLIDTIYNTARPFIYTTALPASICAAALAALEIIRLQPARREILLGLADRLRDALRGRGLDVGPSTTPIIPILLGRADRALEVARKCFEAGFLCPAIRPPTVAPGASRLRVSVMATHDWRDLERFVDVVARA